MPTIDIALLCLAGGLTGALLGKLAIWLVTGIAHDEQRWIAETLAQQGTEATGQLGSVAMPDLPDALRGFGHAALIGLSVACVGFALVLGLRLGVSPKTIALMGFGSVLMTLALIDFKTMLLPDGLTQPLLWLGLLIQIFPTTRTVGLESSVLGGAIGYSLLWVVGALFVRIRHREGLGQGDLKLFSAIGTWLGIGSLPSVLLMAATMALFWQLLVYLWRQSDLKSTFAFGPWLALGAMIHLVFRF